MLELLRQYIDNLLYRLITVPPGLEKEKKLKFKMKINMSVFTQGIENVKIFTQTGFFKAKFYPKKCPCVFLIHWVTQNDTLFAYLTQFIEIQSISTHKILIIRRQNCNKNSIYDKSTFI